jgi:hypothetical protein
LFVTIFFKLGIDSHLTGAHNEERSSPTAALGRQIEEAAERIVTLLMCVTASASSNIQENHFSSKDLGVNPDSRTARLAEIARLTRILRSRSLAGETTRVLLRRLKHPKAPYTDKELSLLLMLSVAEIDARK